MELPAEVVLSFTLQPGALYLFKHDDFPEKYHFFVVLNKSVNPGDTLYMVCASSQVMNRMDYVNRRNISKKTLVIQPPSATGIFKKETIFDCNKVYDVSFEVLRQKLCDHDVPMVEVVSASLLDQLREAVKLSPLVPRKFKKLII
jgi:hypothetical protein